MSTFATDVDKAMAAKDNAGFEALLMEGFMSRDCRGWTKGDRVRVEEEDRTLPFPLVCLTPFGSTELCYWTIFSATIP
jgi:hypothetical protein